MQTGGRHSDRHTRTCTKTHTHTEKHMHAHAITDTAAQVQNAAVHTAVTQL